MIETVRAPFEYRSNERLRQSIPFPDNLEPSGSKLGTRGAFVPHFSRPAPLNPLLMAASRTNTLEPGS